MKELSVGVLGAGLMGAGIAEVAARAGSDVVLVDTDPAAVAKGRARIEKSIRKSAEKGQLSADAANAIVGRVHPASSFDALGAADLVIEAVYEDLAVKKEAFRTLDAVARPSALLATNTSGLSITEISAVTRRPENVIGLHFFYPAPRMALVEMIRGLATSDATFQKAQDFVDAVGKTAILAQDYPGFIVNRVLLPMINEAVFCVMEGAKPEDVDAGMKLGCNHPMGPLELADFVGLDVALATISGLYENLRDSKYRPCPLFVQMVKAGWLGRKTGRGFYKYA
jgi:3-hydroxybutyryl-CoA dehydrogenase